MPVPPIPPPDRQLVADLPDPFPCRECGVDLWERKVAEDVGDVELGDGMIEHAATAYPTSDCDRANGIHKYCHIARVQRGEELESDYNPRAFLD